MRTPKRYAYFPSKLRDEYKFWPWSYFIQWPVQFCIKRQYMRSKYSSRPGQRKKPVRIMHEVKNYRLYTIVEGNKIHEKTDATAKRLIE